MQSRMILLVEGPDDRECFMNEVFLHFRFLI